MDRDGPDGYRRRLVAQKKRKKEVESPPPAASGISGNWTEFVLWAAAILCVLGVAMSYSTDVSRIFDVPKAVWLKTLGCGLFLVWAGLALWGPGVRWRSARLYAGPVLALLAAVGVSTVFSLDPTVSFNGVYERQFGFQGYLACTGLFLVAATCAASRRGALYGFGALVVLGGILGSYSQLQSRGLDPLGFFGDESDKVFSLLGNATYAGNALAMLFPLALVLAVVAAAHALSQQGYPQEAAGTVETGGALVLGILLTLGLQLGMGAVLGQRAEATANPQLLDEIAYQFFSVVGLSAAIALGAALLGSFGVSPRPSRLADGFVAGVLIACVIGIVIGLVHTRTRGAWVGSATATVCLVLLTPQLFKDVPSLREVLRLVCWGAVGLVGLGGTVWVATSDHLYARTIRSIPADMNPYRKDCGKGQCTRPLLWSESTRVLMHHDRTLERLQSDREDYAEKVEEGVVKDMPVRSELPAAALGYEEFLVWPFGIGIETYRYAFMSHKSKRLEELDPMTNHDNPHNNYLYLLASLGVVGLAAYLWLLFRLLRTSFRTFATAPTRDQRAVALGVLASFFSYALYSLAGFDSVFCSVQLYFLLGTAAVYFAPNEGEPAQPLTDHLWGQLKRNDGPVATPQWVAALVSVALASVLGMTIYAAIRVHRAEHAFVGPKTGRPNLQDRILQTRSAIEINPTESYYRVQLGSMYRQRAEAYLRRARQRQAQGDLEGSQSDVLAARKVTRKAEVALGSALNHAWAPENIYISLFQLYAQIPDLSRAEQALEKALMHSPHLGPVRSSLAQLKLDRGAPEEALKDCRWVLDVEWDSPTAHRTCARAYMLLDDARMARFHIERARKMAPGDRLAQRYEAEIEARFRTADTSTSGNDEGDQDQEDGGSDE